MAIEEKRGDVAFFKRTGVLVGGAAEDYRQSHRLPARRLAVLEAHGWYTIYNPSFHLDFFCTEAERIFIAFRTIKSTPYNLQPPFAANSQKKSISLYQSVSLAKVASCHPILLDKPRCFKIVTTSSQKKVARKGTGNFQQNSAPSQRSDLQFDRQPLQPNKCLLLLPSPCSV